MFFGRLSKNSTWLQAFVGADSAKAGEIDASTRKLLRAEQLIFSRWAQVMVRFEKELYSNPEQDLSGLWWGLKAKYQLLNPPDGVLGPDFAAKIHVATVPVYYHNYALGESLASQFTEALSLSGIPLDTVARGFDGVGKWFREEVFSHGSLLPWRELVQSSTGHALSPAAFARQFLS